jgi:hypothetical protein
MNQGTWIDQHVNWFAYLGVILFVGLFLTFGAPAGAIPVWISAYLGIGSHLAWFPVVAALPAPLWARIGGWAWLSSDVILNTMSLNGVTNPDFMAFRLGAHVLAATWVLMTSAQATGVVRYLGYLFAFILGGYSLVAPWVPASALFPAVVVLILWFVVVGRSLAPDRRRTAVQGQLATT